MIFNENKCIPVFLFWTLLWSLFIFLAIASKVLSVSAFDVPLFRYLWNCISCFGSPNDPSAWILKFIRYNAPSSDTIRSKSSCMCYINFFATCKTLILSCSGILQLLSLIQSLLYGQSLQVRHVSGYITGFKSDGTALTNYLECEFFV